MASDTKTPDTYVVEFATFKEVDDKHFHKRLFYAAKTAGLVNQYRGTKLEDPNHTVHVTVWASADARHAFTISLMPFDLKQPILVEILSGCASNTTDALEAPCTEVFTGYHVWSDFVDSTRLYRNTVDAAANSLGGHRVEGYRASVVLETIIDVVVLPVAIHQVPKIVSWPGRAAKLLIGWESHEAHNEAKVKPGPVSENLGLLWKGRRAVDLYHVQFQKL